MGFCLVAKAPQWSVTIFRDDDRKYRTQSLEDFESTGLISNFILKKQDRHFGNFAQVKPDLSGEVHLRSGNTEMAYLPIKGITTQQAEKILYSFYKVPTNGQIPVKFSKITNGGIDWMTGLETKGNVKNFLVTSKIQKQSVPISIFDAPRGYAESKSVQEILLSKSNREASGDFDELFEIGHSRKKVGGK